MIRRTLSTVLVAASLASGAMLAAPADAATAGGTCSLNLPTRIAVNQYFVTRTASASGDCTMAQAEAMWTNDPNFDPNDDDSFFDVGALGFYFRGYGKYDRSAVTFVIGDSVKKWGRNTFYPVYAGRGCDDEGTGNCRTTYRQNTPTTDIRLASRSLLKATRSKGVVTLRGTGKVFSPYRDDYKARIVDGLFQSRAKGGSWETLREVKTTYKGQAAMRVRAAKGKQYRYVTKANPHWWGSASSNLTR